MITAIFGPIIEIIWASKLLLDASRHDYEEEIIALLSQIFENFENIAALIIVSCAFTISEYLVEK